MLTSLPACQETLAAALLCLGVAGCASFPLEMNSGPQEAPLNTGAYDGPECNEVGEIKETKEYWDGRIRTQKVFERYRQGNAPKANAPMATQALTLTCNAVLSDYFDVANSLSAQYRQQHAAFDTRNFDHFRAASMVISCRKAERGKCLDGYRHIVRENRLANPYKEQQANRLEYKAMDFKDHQKYDIGMLSWYAQNVDVDALRAQLDEGGVPPAIAEAFVEDYTDAHAFMTKAVDKLDDIEKEIYVELPNRVRDEREAYHQEYTDLYATLTEAKAAMYAERDAGQVSDQAVDALEEVRSAYLAKCGSYECTSDPFWHEASEALFYAHIARGEAAAAKIEASYISPPSSGHRLSDLDEVSYDIYLAQTQAMMSHQRAHSKYEEAIKQGMDEASAKSTLQGVEPYDFDRRVAWRISSRNVNDFVPRYRQFIPEAAGKIVHVTGQVRRVKKNGDKAKIVFSDKVKEYEKYDCVDTNKIDRITKDGRVRYRQRCKSRGKGVRRTKIEPIVVPAIEAAKLRRGETVSASVITGDREGNIKFAKKGDTIVQVRGKRVTLKD